MIFRAVRNVFPFTSCYILKELGLSDVTEDSLGIISAARRRSLSSTFRFGVCFLGCLWICLWTIIIFGVEICIVSLLLQSFCC